MKIDYFSADGGPLIWLCGWSRRASGLAACVLTDVRVDDQSAVSLADNQSELRQLNTRRHQLEAELQLTHKRMQLLQEMNATGAANATAIAASASAVMTTTMTTTRTVNADGSVTTTTTTTTEKSPASITSTKSVSENESAAVGCSDPLHCNMNGEGFSWASLPEPRQDQLLMGASPKTLANIVNKVSFCTHLLPLSRCSAKRPSHPSSSLCLFSFIIFLFWVFKCTQIWSLSSPIQSSLEALEGSQSPELITRKRHFDC